MQPALLLAGAGRVEQFARQRTRHQEAGPRKQRERRAARYRTDVPLERVRNGIEPGGITEQRCHERARGRGNRERPHAGRPSPCEPPQPGSRHHRRAHHVEDVNLEQVDERSPAKELGLDPEQERQSEDLPATRLDGAGGLGRSEPPRSALGGHRQGDAREHQEHRRRETVEENLIEEPAIVAIGLPRPRVRDVSPHHDHDSDAAKSVEIELALRQGRSS